MNIPKTLVAGDSATWKDSRTCDNLRNSISSPDWTLHYAIRGPSVLDITAQDENGVWVSRVLATDSLPLVPGRYYWQAYATKGTERITLGSGDIDIMPNLGTAEINFDGRTQAKKDLDSCQAAIRSLLTGGAVRKYVIAGREVEKMSVADLLVLESNLKGQVLRENRQKKIASGQGDPMSVLVRFRK